MAKKVSKRGGPRENSGRPIKSEEGKAVPLIASVPEGLVVELKARAAEVNWTTSKAVTEAVRGLLKRKSWR